MSCEILSQIQTAELDAIATGDKYSTLEVISALRKYRACCVKLLNSRYSDGEVDSVSLRDFESSLEEIENPTVEKEPYSSR